MDKKCSVLQVLLVLGAFVATFADPQQQPYPPQQQYPQPQYPPQQYPPQQYPQYPQQQYPQPQYPLQGQGGQVPYPPQVQQPAAVPPHEGRSCVSNFECDGGNTVLTCDKGKCICPARPQIHWTRGTHQLNTVWDSTLRKCLSIRNSACDIHNPKTVFCTQGLVCRPGATKDGFGLCMNKVNKLNVGYTTIIFGMLISYWFRATAI
ncbi:uncharacterized protein LOC110863436 [Folsomia candida]|uniref:uncharacterized protein LOC110863436 n=1 Tax=Folsomia candida TaxID=158441 RepID=UPI000B8F389F|nr:uncharacterized protein LOC110863436 [Folsomia candida]XP_021968437.1 uncharacterized protein LOC110863436 [Folsomia candida]XP_021968438.1 uncharacterized protein LOC110863436 [Folsomia candida]XP_021968439.1 uncharacterized protein LOC110863436 [Folsomia candida]